MVKCTKTKCKNNSCGPKSLKDVQKFILSPKFFLYYLLIFLVFVTIRLFKIPYSSYLCKLLFALGSLAQFVVAYVILLITFFMLTIIFAFVKILITWIKKLFKKRTNKYLWQRIINTIIQILIIIVLVYLFKILLFLIEKLYIPTIYYTFGIVLGYTIIGGNNECIQKSQ